MFERFLIWCDIHRCNKRVKLDISEALKREEVRAGTWPPVLDVIGYAPRARPLVILEENWVEVSEWAK